MATIQDTLRRIENALATRSRPCCDDILPTPDDMVATQNSTQAIIPPELAHQVVPSPRSPRVGQQLGVLRDGLYSTPDQKERIVLLAFTVTGNSGPSDPGIWNLVFSEGKRLGDANKSVHMDGARYTSLSNLTVLGYYNHTTKYANWIGYWGGLLYSNGTCCASETTYPNGDSFRKDGWDPDVLWTTSNKYRIQVRYADTDSRPSGIHFYFHAISQS